MFEHISAAPPDSILGITDAFNRDTNPQKINLSVGVYQDATGRTPVLRCVKEAEARMLDSEKSKTYLGIDGLPSYREHVRKLVFGESISPERIAVVQTPGGTGGVRVAADFLAFAAPHAKLWYSNPTWANHVSIFAAAGVETSPYPYLNDAKTGLDLAGMLEVIESQARRGDAVLLHACCHNPTGIDPTSAQWEEIASLLAAKQLLPFIDFAYQGFGRGLMEDTEGLKIILRHCPEALVASSFSKNFGLYSERVGAVALATETGPQSAIGMSQLKRIVRTNYSNPPRHGGAVVATVLDDAELTELWHQELAEMRHRIAEMRAAFVQKMKQLAPQKDFSFLMDQLGMFSFSGLTPLQVDRLKTEHSLYIVGSGRINVAGMTPANLEPLCQAIATVLQ